MRALAQISLALLVLLPCAASRAGAGEDGRVRGQIEVAVPGANLSELGPLVAYLEAPPGAAALSYAVPSAVPRMRQADARFDPPFLVVTAGQRVSLPNDDPIYHNVFSYSKPNAFDLGLYPQGETRHVTLRFPGVVRTYCSIHESMSGTILVTPSPWHAVAAPSGRFEIRGVPAGSYRLRVWNARLPLASRSVRVKAGGTSELVVSIGAGDGPAPAAPAAAGR
jgi:plastocyanin